MIEVRAGEHMEHDWLLSDLGTVAVRALDSLGQPVSGAEVWVSHCSNQQSGSVVGRTDGLGVLEVPTRVSGGPRHFSVLADGYVSANPRRVDGSLLGRESRAEVEFTLTAGGGIVSGTVSDAAGQPVVGARLSVLPIAQSTYDRRGSTPVSRVDCPPLSAQSDESGNFRFSGLPRVSYELLCEAEGFGTAKIASRDASGQGNHELTLLPESILERRVIDEHGDSIAGARVGLGMREGPGVPRAHTTEDGQFVFRGLAEGELPLRASKRPEFAFTQVGRVQVPVGDRVAHEPIVLSSVRGEPLTIEIDPPLAPDGSTWSVVLAAGDERAGRIVGNEGTATIAHWEPDHFDLTLTYGPGWEAWSESSPVDASRHIRVHVPEDRLRTTRVMAITTRCSLSVPRLRNKGSMWKYSTGTEPPTPPVYPRLAVP